MGDYRTDCPFCGAKDALEADVEAHFGGVHLNEEGDDQFDGEIGGSTVEHISCRECGEDVPVAHYEGHDGKRCNCDYLAERSRNPLDARVVVEVTLDVKPTIDEVADALKDWAGLFPNRHRTPPDCWIVEHVAVERLHRAGHVKDTRLKESPCR